MVPWEEKGQERKECFMNVWSLGSADVDWIGEKSKKVDLYSGRQATTWLKSLDYICESKYRCKQRKSGGKEDSSRKNIPWNIRSQM